MTFDFHPEALVEFQNAARFYSERQAGLELRFIAAVEEAIQRVVESPTRWRVIDDDVRRCLTHVFPYGVLYTVEADRVLIVAVMHCSRKPGYWRTRLDTASDTIEDPVG